MPKWSLRGLRGKRTEKQALSPEMREMLLKLDGVYDPRVAPAPAPDAARGTDAPETATKSS
ncbi:MAG TPA: hypothetical protein VFU99_07165 [Gaiellaceae bacterium]|jgi:hypothetical protein|nr:hypothetical protein [Gaiellaceae bacterium]